MYIRIYLSIQNIELTSDMNTSLNNLYISQVHKNQLSSKQPVAVESCKMQAKVQLK